MLRGCAASIAPNVHGGQVSKFSEMHQQCILCCGTDQDGVSIAGSRPLVDEVRHGAGVLIVQMPCSIHGAVIVTISISICTPIVHCPQSLAVLVHEVADGNVSFTINDDVFPVILPALEPLRRRCCC